MEGNYWSRVLHSRVSRRRVLSTAGAATLGAAFLTACGGGDDEAKPALDESGLVTLPRDESKDGKAGGIMPWNHGALEFVLDPSRAPSFTSWGMIGPLYSSLLKF